MASKPPPAPGALRQQMLDECVAMARYALASGMPVTPSVADSIDSAAANLDEPATLAQLVKAHGQLSRLVAPATPRALLAMGAEHGGNRMAWLGAVGLVQRMMFAAVASVVIFFSLSATPWTSGHVRISYENSTGLEMLANQLFWMSAAGIGASFAMLMQVNGYIVRRTYDPKYEPTYWIKFILGVMAGYILVALIPIGGGESSGGSASLTLPTLAMLGGFSASAVYRILAKLVETLEAVFRSSPAEEMASRERAAQTRATEEVSQARLNIAGQIAALQQQISSGKDPAEVAEALRTMFTTLVPGAAPPHDAATAPPAGAIALPNVPIVSDAGVVQPPVTPAPAPAADASEPSGEDEPVAESDEPAATAPTSDEGDEPRPVAQG